MKVKAKKEYDMLLKSGDLFEMFPDFTGSWKEDKEEFLVFWSLNQKVLEDTTLDIEIEEIIDDTEELLSNKTKQEHE